jgi:hypothetical protein
MNEQTGEEYAVKEMMEALRALQSVKASRENSLVITKLEEAIMWCNKDRTIKGQLTANPTHVQVEPIGAGTPDEKAKDVVMASVTTTETPIVAGTTI